MKINEIKENWENEFNKKFIPEGENQVIYFVPEDINEIKLFISKLLLKEKFRWQRELLISKIRLEQSKEKIENWELRMYHGQVSVSCELDIFYEPNYQSKKDCLEMIKSAAENIFDTIIHAKKEGIK